MNRNAKPTTDLSGVEIKKIPMGEGGCLSLKDTQTRRSDFISSKIKIKDKRFKASESRVKRIINKMEQK